MPLSINVTTNAGTQIGGFTGRPNTPFGNPGLPLWLVCALALMASISYWTASSRRALRHYVCGIGLIMAMLSSGACGGGNQQTITGGTSRGDLHLSCHRYLKRPDSHG